MTGRTRVPSYAAAALAVVFALAFSSRAEAASCGHYVVYKGQQAMEHDGHQAQHVPGDSPDQQRPCNGPNCSRAPAGFPPAAPTTKVSLEKQPAYASQSEVTLDGYAAAELFGGTLLVTRYSPADIFRPPCCA